MPPSPASADLVVLLDEAGRPCGTFPRASVHTADTPLHQAFSCHLFDEDGRVLLTRRALGKRAWPGVWTNAFCGHPRPGEDTADAVRRYARHELGIAVRDLDCVLPAFRYRAVDPSGVVENEVCPVYLARHDTQDGPALAANPDEVAETRWMTPEEMLAAVTAAPWALSPWMVQQVRQIEAVGWRSGSRTHEP
ncbi:isopentenyl-diphosphate Delta-isomerase [Janibacter sp. GS2]|uniref:isopentenyl-diphosphate Delta-isomerase n=1 Tax=Janibacter sp. GS2 TaxID=3442646 RepID=UPI003EB9CEFA